MVFASSCVWSKTNIACSCASFDLSRHHSPQCSFFPALFSFNKGPCDRWVSSKRPQGCLQSAIRIWGNCMRIWMNCWRISLAWVAGICFWRRWNWRKTPSDFAKIPCTWREETYAFSFFLTCKGQSLNLQKPIFYHSTLGTCWDLWNPEPLIFGWAKIS